MNNLDADYLNLLREVLSQGHRKDDRTGTGTYSLFGKTISHDMSEGFPLLTTKKIFTKAVVHELLWFLQGGDNIQYLCKNGVTIWDEWPHKRYMEKKSESDPAYDVKQFAKRVAEDDEFAREWGKLGPVYGNQWIYWQGQLNQLDAAIELLRKDPDSRRIMVSAWNPSDLPRQVLPPCHYLWILNTRVFSAHERVEIAYPETQDEYYKEYGVLGEAQDALDCRVVNKTHHDRLTRNGVPEREVSMIFNMRSVDCFLGMPFDIASYGVLLEMIAQVAGMQAGKLVGAFADTHIYLNHVDAVQTQLAREPFELPKIRLNREIKSIYDFRYEDVSFENYQSHPSIKAEVAV
jgi:thymidylate synthase